MIWQRQLDEGKPITVTDEKMERYFMTIEEAVKLIIEVIGISQGGEVVCFDMGKKVNIMKLALELVNQLRYGEIKTIGIRPGEVLSERLMTLEEEARVIKQGKFFIIKNGI